MIADELHRQAVDLVYPGGVRHSEAIAPVRDRIDAASVFLIDRDAVAMAAHVSLSRPSSVLASLPWVRLPFRTVFVEFENAHLREAMGELGSPLMRPPDGEFVIVRSGFLLTEDGDSLCVEYVHSDRDREGRRVADVAPVLGRFDLVVDREPTVAAARETAGRAMASGRVRDYLDRLARDPLEQAASDDLAARFTWVPHPDLELLREGVSRLFSSGGEDGAAAVARIEENQGRDAARLFVQFVLPMLILMATRNAVETVRVEPEERLAKARRRKGRRPPPAYSLVRLRLGAARKRAEAACGDGGERFRAALVRGHFKVRRTGVFWWTPHLRGGGEPEIRDYVVGG